MSYCGCDTIRFKFNSSSDVYYQTHTQESVRLHFREGCPYTPLFDWGDGSPLSPGVPSLPWNEFNETPGVNGVHLWTVPGWKDVAVNMPHLEYWLDGYSGTSGIGSGMDYFSQLRGLRSVNIEMYSPDNPNYWPVGWVYPGSEVLKGLPLLYLTWGIQGVDFPLSVVAGMPLYSLSLNGFGIHITGSLLDMGNQPDLDYFNANLSDAALEGGFSNMPNIRTLSVTSTETDEAKLTAHWRAVYENRFLFKQTVNDYGGISIGAGNYQDANAPTTAAEYAYIMRNNPRSEAFYTWSYSP